MKNKRLKYKFLSFDLSKSNTGVCVCYLDNEFQSIKIETKSLIVDTLPYFSISHATDCQFISIRELCKKIENEIKKDDLIKFIILEFPIFHSFTTELSYYYFQSVLELAFKYGIDCIGVVPNTLKKYINHLYKFHFKKEIPKKGKVLDKSEIKYIFENLKEIGYFTKYLNLKDPKNNDEMDAFFLMDYILNSFNKEYLSLMDQEFLNPKDYESLGYVPLVENEYNIKNHLNNDFFTLKDRKFYPLKYFKKINFIKTYEFD